MIDHLIVLPVIIPLFAAALCLIFRQKTQAQRWIFLIAIVSSLGFSGSLLYQTIQQNIIVSQMGSVPAPFGISFVADKFSALLSTTAALIYLVVFIFTLKTIDPKQEKAGFYPLMLFMLMGINGAFLTGDIFNLYVWYEIILISSFVLIALGDRKNQLEGALKYALINFLASGLLLMGIGIVYAATGSLNMARVAQIFAQSGEQSLAAISASFFIISFGIKSALFPLYFWLPASYHSPPTPIIAIIAGTLTKVGLYSLIRFFTLIYYPFHEIFSLLFLCLSGATMLVGAIGSVAHQDLRKILSYQIIAHMGYMLMGIGIFTTSGLSGTAYYLIQDMIVISGLFVAIGLIGKMGGSFLLYEMKGGLMNRSSLLSMIFLIPALSLSGIPPLSGFWGKLLLIKASIATHAYWIVFVALLAVALTLYVMMKIWIKAFWGKYEAPETQTEGNNPGLSGWISSGIFGAIILLLSLYPEPLVNLSLQIGEQLTNPEIYINNVLNP